MFRLLLTMEKKFHSQGIMSLFIIVGPVIGTLIYSSLGLTYSLAAMIGLFLTAAIVQFSLPPFLRSPERSTVPILEDIKEGFRYIRSQRNLIVIALSLPALG